MGEAIWLPSFFWVSASYNGLPDFFCQCLAQVRQGLQTLTNMCGITGIYAFNMVGGFNMINLAAATMALESRGPDYNDTYHDDTVGLGHRRLAIIDTSSAGNQPMYSADGQYVIVFNGEIYNYPQLKATLVAQGVAFQSDTDTEVLLQLYIKHGADCLPMLNGFFAFAVYHKASKSLFVARDRMGIKPLYYYYDEDKLLFASELKSLLAYGIKKKLDYAALYQYLQLNYIAAPATALEGVKKLMPGTYISINAGKLTSHRYYEIPYDSAQAARNNTSYTVQKQKLAEHLETAVQRRLVADVPLGTFLSGGIDSSVVTALASRHKPGLHSFSIGFKDEKFFDETDYARLVAKKLGTEHTVFSLTNQDLYTHVHSILDYLDEPFADSSAIAVYILSQATRKHATVALSGDGADEIFTGYNKHAAFQRVIQGGTANNLIKAMGPLWDILPKSRSNGLTNKFRQLHRFSHGLKLPAKERYWQWASFVNEKEALNLLSENAQQALAFEEYQQRKEASLASIPDRENINDLLYADMGLVLANDMLVKVDLMSMANSLEVRVPFLDHEVVNFAFSLPVEHKINTQMRKRILQDTYRDILPDALYNRPKKGFEVPLLKWFRKEMKSLIVDDLLSANFVKEQGVFNPAAIELLKKRLFSSNPGDVHAQIWALIVFQWWWKKYFNV